MRKSKKTNIFESVKARVSGNKIHNEKIGYVSSLPAMLVQVKTHGEPMVYNLPKDKEFFIGRSDENDLCLDAEDISETHAKIRLEEDGYILYDLESDTGITINWEKKLKRKLEHRDRIKIGSHVLVFEFAKHEDNIFDGREKRKTTRTNQLITIQFVVYSGVIAEESLGIVKDMSLDGAKIETEKEIRKSDIMEACISSEQLPTVEVIAQVIWVGMKEQDDKRLYEAGIQFVEMDESSRDRLKNYLIKCFSK